jgi:hypothetical protein
VYRKIQYQGKCFHPVPLSSRPRRTCAENMCATPEFKEKTTKQKKLHVIEHGGGANCFPPPALLAPVSLCGVVVVVSTATPCGLSEDHACSLSEDHMVAVEINALHFRESEFCRFPVQALPQPHFFSHRHPRWLLHPGRYQEYHLPMPVSCSIFSCCGGNATFGKSPEHQLGKLFRPGALHGLPVTALSQQACA